jgi:hypothetical protein
MRPKRRPRRSRKLLLVDSPPKAISSTQNRSYLCSAFLFLEEVAILSSRAYLFELTSRDLVGLMEANHSFRGSSFLWHGHKKKSVGRLRLVPSQDDRLSRTHRGSSDWESDSVRITHTRQRSEEKLRREQKDRRREGEATSLRCALLASHPGDYHRCISVFPGQHMF